MLGDHQARLSSTSIQEGDEHDHRYLRTGEP
jgi:hypothetical protein